MSRLLFEEGEQRKFLIKVRQSTGLAWKELAGVCNISTRTLRDWVNEESKIRHDAAVILCKIATMKFPRTKGLLPEYWNVRNAARLGGISRHRKYGNFGTFEGRRRGGVKSQEKFHSNPAYAESIGVKVRKKIAIPAESELLAEFIGIMLGDGGITRNQIKITFNRTTDALYSKFVQEVISKLFGVDSTIIRKKSDKGDDVLVSSVNLVEFLVKKGLRVGSKIRNNVDIPEWVFRKKIYMIGCLRGLVDTDGSVYLYKHRVNGKDYLNFSICFTNHSGPLLASLFNLLLRLGFNPVKTSSRVYLHKNVDIIKYFDIIKPSNPKHSSKYKIYRKLKDD
ncbi:MAG: hypothetical protein KJ880_06095 [Candidatus Omnitrophica bacterium]|nr:hypothetical protein [Candidatus Omnitrophota bacterium]MBU1869721.1 hypothetical protein [Candidatus Omnitrophota bacterium]